MCLYSPVFFFRFESLCFRMPRITWLTNYYFTSADVSLLAHFFVFHLRHFNGAELLFSPTTAPFVNLKTHCILLHDYTIHHFEGIRICQKLFCFQTAWQNPSLLLFMLLPLFITFIDWCHLASDFLLACRLTSMVLQSSLHTR